MDLIVYRSRADATPLLLSFLDGLRTENATAYQGCLALLDLLAEQGHRLRRPHSGALGDGLFELRCREGGIQVRISTPSRAVGLRSSHTALSRRRGRFPSRRSGWQTGASASTGRTRERTASDLDEQP